MKTHPFNKGIAGQGKYRPLLPSVRRPSKYLFDTEPDGSVSQKLVDSYYLTIPDDRINRYSRTSADFVFTSKYLVSVGGGWYRWTL